MSLADLRREYLGQPLSESESDADPFVQFARWFEQVRETEADPTAMALATATREGHPSVRNVLLKGVDERGFVFYTNLESAKGEELKGNPQAALCFHWKSLERQVRVRGPVVAVSAEEADAYFATRPKDSQIGAWASRQSRAMVGRFALEKEVARFAAKYALSSVPRPPHWSGFRVQPLQIEFWRARAFRLHERLCYRRATLNSAWTTERLFP
jgi:pyridoxamine 5'-phosphate oxidase